MSEHAHESSQHVPAEEHVNHRGTYMKIFWVLLVLTIVEVALSFVKMDRRVLAALMVGLALTKASFVGLFFMHLKYEKKSLLWLAAVPLPLAGFYAIFLMLDSNHLVRAITIPFVHH